MNQPITKYNPAFLNEDEIIDSFVVREAELNTLIQILKDNSDGSNQHVLMVGPRGIGKTTLLERLRAEINRNDDLCDTWFPIKFAEESYQVSTTGEFWLEALLHLSDQTENSNLRKSYDELLTETKEKDLKTKSLAKLLDYSDKVDKKLILMVENLNMILGEQLSDDEAWNIRHTLQNEPRIMLLATATTRFDEIQNEKKAMFEQFRIIDLDPLNEEQCKAIWDNVTNDDLPVSRLKPLKILTGGNPRLIKIAATFGSSLSLKRLEDELLQLVDDHTEYFKSHIDNLPQGQRKVYLSLAELWDPSTAKEVSKNARLDVNKTSSLLNRLVKRGAVTVVDKTGRKKLYQLTERMFNIYYLIRHRGQQTGRIKAIVKFMISFYGMEELIDRTTKIAKEACEASPDQRDFYYKVWREIIQHAQPDHRVEIVNSLPDELLQGEQIPSDFQSVLDETFEDYQLEEDEYEQIKKIISTIFNETFEINKSNLDSETLKDVIETLEQIEEKNEYVLTFLAMLYFFSNEHEKTKELCERASNINSDFPFPWIIRGKILHGIDEKYKEALKAYQKAIELDSDIALAWSDLAELYHIHLDEFSKAEEAYERAVELDSTNGWTWSYYGLLLKNMDKIDQAVEAFQKAIELIEKDEEPLYGNLALINYGEILYSKKDEIDKAEKMLEKAKEIDQEDPRLWVELGDFNHYLERYEKSRESFETAIQIDSEYDYAWAKLGELQHYHLEEYKEAEAAYKKAVEINDDYTYAIGHLAILLHDHLENFEEAYFFYIKANALEPEVPIGWAKLGQLLHQEFDLPNQAKKSYIKAIDVGDQLNRSTLNSLRGLLILESESKNNIEGVAARKAEKFLDLADEEEKAENLNELAWLFYKVGSKKYLERSKNWINEAVKLAPDNGDYHHTYASILVEMDNLERALEESKEYVGFGESVKKSMENAIELFTNLVAKGKGDESLAILENSDTSKHLEPLIVGIKLYLDKEILKASEIMEVAQDVKKRIEDKK